MVRHEVVDGVGVVTLCDPAGRNALDLESTTAVRDAVVALEADPATEVLLMRAEGGAFCVGGDLGAFAQAGDEAHAVIAAIGEPLNELIPLLHETPKITIAAVHGPVAGGGVGLMAAHDVVLAARSTVVTLGYELLAGNPDAGVSWFLPRDLGYRRALELYLTSERLDAQRALELGLVNEVVDDDALHDRAVALARRLASGSFGAHAAAKQLFRQAAHTPLAEHCRDEIRLFSHNARRPEFAAGVRRFLESRGR